MKYRRIFVPGGTYFFTINLANRTNSLLVEHVNDLKRAFAKVKQSHPFKIKAWVILPEHLHTIWELPDGDSDYPTRIRLIKSHFSRSIPVDEFIKPSRIKRKERGLWQRRYWERAIRDAEDLLTHINYIHNNPIKHGYVDSPYDWPYSSIHHF